MDATSPGTSDAFWSTAAQITPVLAFALILQVRKTALAWSARQRVLRLIQSIGYFVVMGALVFSFSRALGSLITGTTDFLAMAVVANVLTGTATLLLLNPIIDLVIRANPDWGDMVRDLRPGSRWRAQRRKHKYLVKMARNYAAATELLLASSDSMYLKALKAENQMKSPPLASLTVTDWMAEGESNDSLTERAEFAATYSKDSNEPAAKMFGRFRKKALSEVRVAQHLEKVARDVTEELREMRHSLRLFAVADERAAVYDEQISIAARVMDDPSLANLKLPTT